MVCDEQQRAASDFLYIEKNGKYSVFLNILSADLQTGTIVLTRNNPTPIFIAQADRIECLPGGSNIGQSRNFRPAITEIDYRGNNRGHVYGRFIAGGYP